MSESATPPGLAAAALLCGLNGRGQSPNLLLGFWFSGGDSISSGKWLCSS